MRVTLKAVNDERPGSGRRPNLRRPVATSSFAARKPDEWIDRTVPVTTISSLALEQWIEEPSAEECESADHQDRETRWWHTGEKPEALPLIRFN
jgi:hypothetical protein